MSLNSAHPITNLASHHFNKFHSQQLGDTGKPWHVMFYFQLFWAFQTTQYNFSISPLQLTTLFRSYHTKNMLSTNVQTIINGTAFCSSPINLLSHSFIPTLIKQTHSDCKVFLMFVARSNSYSMFPIQFK